MIGTIYRVYRINILIVKSFLPCHRIPSKLKFQPFFLYPDIIRSRSEEEEANKLNNKLDLDQLNKATKILFNHSDFKSFSKSKSDVKTFNCNIMDAKWKLDGDILIFSIKADRFLRNMVRAIVGTLIEIGQNRLKVEDFNQIILKKDRKYAGYSVPACGLYLTKIEYNIEEIINV